jgi:hypothetical protein
MREAKSGKCCFGVDEDGEMPVGESRMNDGFKASEGAYNQWMSR